MRMSIRVGHSPQTRSLFAPGGFTSLAFGFAELLHTTQKTKLPCLSTVCSGKPNTMPVFLLTIAMI